MVNGEKVTGVSYGEGSNKSVLLSKDILQQLDKDKLHKIEVWLD